MFSNSSSCLQSTDLHCSQRQAKERVDQRPQFSHLQQPLVEQALLIHAHLRQQPLLEQALLIYRGSILQHSFETSSADTSSHALYMTATSLETSRYITQYNFSCSQLQSPTAISLETNPDTSLAHPSDSNLSVTVSIFVYRSKFYFSLVQRCHSILLAYTQALSS